ncbi:junctional sarcoplasmic reticulum protein 1 [Anolis carolinensis]|uniref:junctional sarcoplasmic reticulum protein 1 n=1 Tax=Anolis carolinensis TaxID=28377 RepID=UPI002F2B565C
MASGPCEALEPAGEDPQESPQVDPRKQGQGDAKKPSSQEEMLSTPNGIDKAETEKLHVVDKDLEEFVDSVAEVARPARRPVTPPKAPAKSPRAEQVAEKVLRAEKVTERPPPRAEKAPVSHPAPKMVPAKRKTTPKETLPWEGLTLNKCLLVASVVALLSVSCQVVQDIIDYGETILKAELEAWSQQEDSTGELDERWFYERWLDWSDTEEPPDIEEEEEEEEEETVEMEEEEEEKEATEEEKEEDEEHDEDDEERSGKQPAVKKSRREKPAKEQAVKGLKAGPKEEEVRRRKGKEEKEESKVRTRIRSPKEKEEESKARIRSPKEEGKRFSRIWSPKGGRDEAEKARRKAEKDYKAHERKERKPTRHA